MRYFGVFAKKLGMTQIKKDDLVLPITLLLAEKVKVLSYRTQEKNGYDAVLLGCGEGKEKSWNKPQKSLFNGEFSQVIGEFRCKNSLNYEVGDYIDLEKEFSLNSLVDVTAKSVGKGFTGVIKRHNFSGMPASHGVSKAHRAHGSTGHRTYPGRVFKGKKMAGRDGNSQVTIKNLKVVVIDKIDNSDKVLIGVHGSIPGHKNSWCRIYKQEAR